MKNLFFSLALLSLPMMACAEYPQASIEASSAGDGDGDVGGQGGGTGSGGQHGDHDEHSDETIEELAMLLNGQCGEGPFKSDTNIYLAQHDGDFLISFGYIAGDGHKNADGKLGYFYKDGGSFTEAPVDGAKLVLAGLLLTSSTELQNPNMAGPLVNSSDPEVRETVLAYYEVSFKDSAEPQSVISGIENALNGDQVEADFFKGMITITLHGDHPHFPSCDSINWGGELVEWGFNFQSSDNDHDHDHD